MLHRAKMIKMFKKIPWKISREACFGLPQSRLVPGRMAIKPLWYGDISFVRCFPLKIQLVFLIDTALSGSNSKFGRTPALAEATLEVCANSLAKRLNSHSPSKGFGDDLLGDPPILGMDAIPLGHLSAVASSSSLSCHKVAKNAAQALAR